MCTSPLRAYRNPAGGQLLFKNITHGVDGRENFFNLTRQVEIGCGQCWECRLQKVRDWAVRMMCEAWIQEENGRGSTMLTLTYDPENVPYVYDGKNRTDVMTLSKRDLNLFTKRLRERLRRRGLENFKYFGCGEYGDNGGELFGRPHYHIILMGVEFNDKYLWSTSEAGYPVCKSDLLDSVWCFGLATISDFDFGSAEYCVKDVLKRITESDTESHKKWLKEHKLENLDQYYEGRQKEFHLSSNRPGIGSGWIDKYGKTVFPNGKMPKMNGTRMNPPRYFKDRYIEKEYNRRYAKMQKKIQEYTDTQIKQKTETQQALERSRMSDLLTRSNIYEQNLQNRNRKQKRLRRVYNEFKSSNSRFFDI